MLCAPTWGIRIWIFPGKAHKWNIIEYPRIFNDVPFIGSRIFHFEAKSEYNIDFFLRSAYSPRRFVLPSCLRNRRLAHRRCSGAQSLLYYPPSRVDPRVNYRVNLLMVCQCKIRGPTIKHKYAPDFLTLFLYNRRLARHHCSGARSLLYYPPSRVDPRVNYRVHLLMVCQYRIRGPTIKLNLP